MPDIGKKKFHYLFRDKILGLENETCFEALLPTIMIAKNIEKSDAIRLLNMTYPENTINLGNFECWREYR